MRQLSTTIRTAFFLALLGATQSCESQPDAQHVVFPDPATEPDPSMIRLVEGPAGWFEVRGLLPAGIPDGDLDPAVWSPVLAAYVEGAEPIPMVGRYTKEGSTLRFQPRYPLVDELRYRVVCKPRHIPGSGAAPRSLVAYFQMPPREAQPTAVVGQVYPTAGVLPENLLRFYVLFSEPMRRGEAHHHIHLLDDKGKPIAGAFLDEELWDPSGRRLTLLLDPARVKRGLAVREEVGPVLQDGKKYTLVIDRDWPDVHGWPLREVYRKGFRVGPAQRSPVDLASWHVTPPPAGRRAILAVDFGTPLDHALLQRMLTVTDAAGHEVSGVGKCTDNESIWKFVSYAPWSAGTYYLVADPALEDPAGNSVAQPFERDLTGPTPTARTNRLPFHIE
jgi:hypothetical protein